MMPLCADTECGLPQGAKSPHSLWMLYAALKRRSSTAVPGVCPDPGARLKLTVKLAP
jgi:hypothetical protein